MFFNILMIGAFIAQESANFPILEFPAQLMIASNAFHC